ncbi:MAG: exonuclease SbcCD subunit D [Bacilli bacterium]|jgi:exonuclease SbcD
MKLIHISDLHLGRTVNQVSLLADQEYLLMEQIAPLIKEKQADVLLISGDIFDTYNPSNESMDLYDRFLNKVHSYKTKIIAISGNHDSPIRIEHHQKLLMDSGYYVSASFTGSLMKVTLNDKFGPVNFYLLPYFTPEQARRFFPDETKVNTTYDEAVKLTIGKEQINLKERNVILSHQYVVGASRDPSDTKPLLRNDVSDAVGLDAYNDFDYVALGHIHKTLRLRNNTIVYPGSILPYCIGESNDRYVSYVELNEKNSLKSELIPIYPKRKLLTLKGSYDELIKYPTDKENYIEIVLTDDKTSPTLASDFTALFPYLLTIRREIKNFSSATDSSLPEYNPSASVFDSIQGFYKDKTGEELDEASSKIVQEILEECLKEEKE